MAFFTQAEVRKAAQQAIPAGRSARDALNDAQRNSKETDRFDVFLSHAMLDAELVLGIKVLLETEGQRVYVDWFDDQGLERDRVTAETADVLRKRMRQSESLLYVATENATKSKWMPWELGYFDGFKNGGVAILPVLDKSDAQFNGQEYLGLYPAITREMLTNSKAKLPIDRVRPRPYELPSEIGSTLDPRLPKLPFGTPKIFL